MTGNVQVFYNVAGVPKRYGRGGSDNPTPGTRSTPWLPFDAPTRAALAASPQRVWAHYMLQFCLKPGGLNVAASAGDYYQKYWLPPGAVEVSTDWMTYGGFIRDRPLDRPASTATQNVNVGVSGYTLNTPRWQIDDKLTEIRAAYDAGLDGFTVDQTGGGVGSTGQPYRQWREMIYAADEFNDKTFRLVMMPDASTGATSTYQQLAGDMNEAAGHVSVYKQPSGNLLVAPYGPEFAPAGAGNDPNFWPNFKTYMSSQFGKTVDLWFVYSQSWLSNTHSVDAPHMNAIAYGHSRWGDRDPVTNSSTSTMDRGAAAYCQATFGKPWMTPVSTTDERTQTGNKFNEPRNSENWRTTWLAAIEQRANAPWVQIPTWSDYMENAHIAPSRNHGYCYLDIGQYYLTKFKLDYYPTIIRPCIYLSHRVQPFDNSLGTLTYTADPARYTTRMVPTGGTSPVNQIEALAFLPEAATVTITVNGATVKSQACAPGVTSVVGPLGLGTVAATAVNAAGVTIAQITSPWTVSTTQPAQDLNYRYVSSLRGA